MNIILEAYPIYKTNEDSLDECVDNDFNGLKVGFCLVGESTLPYAQLKKEYTAIIEKLNLDEIELNKFKKLRESRSKIEDELYKNLLKFDKQFATKNQKFSAIYLQKLLSKNKTYINLSEKLKEAKQETARIYKKCNELYEQSEERRKEIINEVGTFKEWLINNKGFNEIKISHNLIENSGY